MIRSKLPNLESACVNLSQWHIERISLNSIEYCRGQIEVKRCGAKIAHYQRAVVAPTFSGFEKQSRGKDPRQVQFWFCPTNILTCVLGPAYKSIMYYPNIPKKWHVKTRASLTQSEVTTFESARFILEDGQVFHTLPNFSECGIESSVDSLLKDASTMQNLSQVEEVKSPIVSDVPSVGIQSFPTKDGDKCPSSWNRKPFQFVA